jgi:hypothetical protein
MAKKLKLPKHSTGRTITTKSPYGSHSEMIVQDKEILKTFEISVEQVLCKDDEGYYVTQANRIDSGLADPNRYSNR